MRTSLFRFLKNNDDKKLTLAVWYLAGYYRAEMLFVPAEKLEKKWGVKGEESPMEAKRFDYWYAAKIAREIGRITYKTPWESKCLVQAQTARYLMHRKGIPTTLYLGVGYDEGKMVAHAWIRVGQFYITGGNGEGYAVVAKFCK